MNKKDFDTIIYVLDKHIEDALGNLGKLSNSFIVEIHLMSER